MIQEGIMVTTTRDSLSTENVIIVGKRAISNPNVELGSIT
jgi:hypothetical protein